MDVTSGPGPGRDGPAVDGPDDRDLDDGGLDLTPRPVGDGPGRAGRRRRRRWVPLAVLAVLAVVLAFIVVQARGASLYFRNADEAIEQRDSLGTSKFRLQGTVIGRPVQDEDATTFTVEFNDAEVRVRHTGSEPALFEEGIPVVAEGRWNQAGTVFESDRLLVKHDEDYKDYDEENPERVKDSQSTNS